MKGIAAAAGLFLLSGLAVSTAEVSAGPPAAEETAAAGQRIYREGTLPSGEPVRAVVQGDIPVDGEMFTCESCHLRSGLGSVEGTLITLPTNSVWLLNPRPSINTWRLLVERSEIRPRADELPYLVPEEDLRPAYTDSALAAAIRTGRDPGGRRLSPTMPRYVLDEPEMAALSAYLRQLSAEYSPGVTDETIHVATVVSTDVPERDRESMLDILTLTVDIHNRQWRSQKRRDEKGPFYRQEMYVGFRTLTLHVWTVDGPREGWGRQLDEHLARQPVFALLGGIATGDWEPVHRFSEKHRIPCIFPATERPVVDEESWYTLYFSKGHYLEGETAAKHLRKSGSLPEGTRVVQIVRRGAAEAAARGFRRIWERSGRAIAHEVLLEPGEQLTARRWKETAGGDGPVAVAAWLEPGDYRDLASLLSGKSAPELIVVSGGLVGEDLSALPGDLQARALVTWPYILPQDGGRRRLSVRAWLKAHGMEEKNFAIQSRMYFLGWMFPAVLNRLRHQWYSDYLLDLIDMKDDEDYAIALYPSLTFGQGQRYASKSCYIVRLEAGAKPALTPLTGRIVY